MKYMTERKKNGFVIEMMMIFMLITFGFCILITTVIMGLNKERKYSHANIQMQTDLNQIGEYYIRYVELSGKNFPTGTEKTNQGAKIPLETVLASSEFEWMTEEIKNFFLRKENNYEYSVYYTIKRGNVFEFFTTKEIWRKLVVKSKDDGKIKLIIELTEKRSEDASSIKADYKVENWSMGDDLTDETSDSYVKDNISILQKLWGLLGVLVRKTNAQVQQFINSVADFATKSMQDIEYSLEYVYNQILDSILSH